MVIVLKGDEHQVQTSSLAFRLKSSSGSLIKRLEVIFLPSGLLANDECQEKNGSSVHSKHPFIRKCVRLHL